jgi:1,4-alpha-glucan branching enzyme
MTVTEQEPVGTCCIVLHSHLPWVLHHGEWPVGEEWLYQAWAASYLPVVSLLEQLAAEGRRDLLTLGVTPVLAAQLDDGHALRAFHTWLGFWRSRAEGLASRGGPAGELGRTEVVAAAVAMRSFEDRWSGGASAVLRPLVDAGVVELLGGPATHPFIPLLDERIADLAMRTGLDDQARRLGRRASGLWAPECGYRPGLEQLYARHDIDHLMVDGPTLLGAGASTAGAWRLGDSDVVAFGRDLEVTYRVWSPRKGYPAGSWYRDFHTWDEASGLRLSRVTSTRTAPQAKEPYDPSRATGAVAADVKDFVLTVRRRLEQQLARDGRRGVVVVAYDTELFGHWWHEGPQFLEQVLRALPRAGVQLRSLAGAIEDGAVRGRVEPGPGSWGSGKDWRVWDGEAVADVVSANAAVQTELLRIVDTVAPTTRDGRRGDLDQLARDALLMVASDWAFMVSHGSAVDYARSRISGHEADFMRLAESVRKGDNAVSRCVAKQQALSDGPFPHLDARLLAQSAAVPAGPG